MRVLFITKPFLIEPLGLMHLSAAAKKEGHEVGLSTTKENLEEKILNYNPDVVGYSVMTGDHTTFAKINRELKHSRNFFSVFGGPHTTFFPEFIKEEGVDAICIGEGEEAFTELLNKLEEDRDYSTTQNFWVKIDGKIRENNVRPFSDVDSLPHPDRDLVNKLPEIREGPIKHFLASRGCPFKCTYCFNKVYFEIYGGKGKRVRFRNVIDLVSEIEEVVTSSPTKFVYFQDDTFTLNRKWLSEFAEEYSRRIKLPFHCHVRPNTLDEDFSAILNKAGCYSAHIAAETADDRIRNEVLKRNMSREQIINATRLLRKSGIKFMLQNMIGLPTGNLETDLATLELNIECQPDYAWVSIFQPYPGTELGKFCRKNGYYTGDFSDIDSNFFDESKLSFSEEYKNQLQNLQKIFAIIVENPDINRYDLTKPLINAPHSTVKDIYQRAYKEFRKLGDKRLFGFEL